MNARVTIKLPPEELQKIILEHFKDKQIASGVTFKTEIQYEDRGDGQESKFICAELDIIIEI